MKLSRKKGIIILILVILAAIFVAILRSEVISAYR